MEGLEPRIEWLKPRMECLEPRMEWLESRMEWLKPRMERPESRMECLKPRMERPESGNGSLQMRNERLSPQEHETIDYELQNLNCRLLLALLGVDSSYISTPVDSQEQFLLAVK